MEYYIISAANIIRLDEDINEYAKRGWRLVNICVKPPGYFAAMERMSTKIEDREPSCTTE